MKKLREKRQVSEMELARATHIPYDSIVAIEEEIYIVNIEEALAIAKYFGLLVEKVFKIT